MLLALKTGDRFLIIVLRLNECAAPKDFCMFLDDSINIENSSVEYDHARFSLCPLWNPSESEGAQATCVFADARLKDSASVQLVTPAFASSDVLQRLQVPNFDG
jgi:hypothetical protein